VTTQGCDYAWERPDPVALRAAGYLFAIRYLSRDTSGKNLTAAEAQALHAAGLSIVLNWEYAPGAARNGFGQGVRDAADASWELLSIGAPADSVVYFSVDWDAQPADFPAISDYFRGCASVLTPERVGVYGGYAAVALLAPSPYCLWFWQTYAWSDGRWHGAAHIRQTANEVPFGGLKIDLDTAMTDHYGQWPPTGGNMTEPMPHEVVNLITNGSNDDGFLAGEGSNVGGAYAYNLRLVRSDLATIRSQVQSNGSTLSSLLSKVDALGARLDTLEAKVNGYAGTMHVVGDLTVGG
jgi:Domain of unknown function (DUF1906)